MNDLAKKATSITIAGLFTLAGPVIEALKELEAERLEIPIIKFVRVEETPTPKRRIPAQEYSIAVVTSSTATGPNITIANTVIGDDFEGYLDPAISEIGGHWTVVSSGDAIMARRS